MYCPECRSEFREGVTHCQNCQVDLIAEAPDQDPFSSPERMAQMLADKDLQAVIVGPYTSMRETQKLLSEVQIASIIAPEEGQELQPGLHERLYLMIASDDLDRVRTFFDQRWEAGMQTEGLMLKKPGSTADAEEDTGSDAAPCPACSTPVPAVAEECPECGLFVGAAAGDEEEAADEESAP